MELTQLDQVKVSKKDYPSKGDYEKFLQDVRQHFADGLAKYGNKLFRTHVGALATSGFNNLYLQGIATHGPDEEQHYNCRCCRRFMEHFGDLAFVDQETGKAVSAFWNADAVDEFFKPAVAAMQAKVERSAVQAVFVPNQRELGIALAGNFNHFAVVVPEFMVWKREDMEAHEKEALFSTDFDVLHQSLIDYPVDVVRKAHALLHTPAAFRGEKAEGPINFFLEVAEKAAALKGTDRRNYIWSKVAYAPSGFAKPRNTVISCVLDGIKEGVDVNALLKTFNQLMDPMKYQRTEAEAVKKGQIEAAERLVEKLGLESAFVRRAARLEDLPIKVWEPSATDADPAEKQGGIFGVLKESTDKTTQLDGTVIKGGSITWAKFKETVLSSAKAMQVYIPNRRVAMINYITAADPEAKHLYRWESDEAPCPFTLYRYNNDVDPRTFNLSLDTWVDVTAIAPLPWEMGTSGESFGLPKGVCFMLKGAYDQNEPFTPHFPENLRTELHPIGNVIEAFGHKTKLVEPELGSAAGIGVNEHGGNLIVKVNNGMLSTQYVIDRWN